MAKRRTVSRAGMYLVIAVALGLAIAWADVLAPFGDDSEKLTMLLWPLSCGLLALAQPLHAWRWALLVGPWVGVLHAARLALGLPDSAHPPTYTTALLLIPVSLAICLVGAYAGALVRCATRRAAATQEP